jgi:hypothetical protein
MRHFGWNTNQIALFEWSSKKNWKFGHDIISWSVGQPLGLLPSFHSFGCTHSALLRGIEMSIHGYPTDRYCIVGDDVVIADAKVAKVYAQVMNSLGVKTSDDKSSHGSRYVEFCGRVIDQGNKYKIGKSKPVKASSFLSLGHEYGKSFKYEATRFLKGLNVSDPSGLVDAIFSLPLPYGLGFGDGIPLRQRLNNPLAAQWVLQIKASFGKLKKPISSGFQMLHHLSTEFGHSPYQRTSPNTGASFIVDRDNVHVTDKEPSRVFISYPKTCTPIISVGEDFQTLQDIIRGIIRDPVEVGSRLMKAFASFAS